MSREEEGWGASDEKGGGPMVVMPRSGGSLGAAITRTTLNLFLITFMLAVVGLAVAAVFIRLQYEEKYADEQRLTRAPVAEVVQYAAWMNCTRRDVQQNAYGTQLLPPAPIEGETAEDTARISQLRLVSQQAEARLDIGIDPPEEGAPPALECADYQRVGYGFLDSQSRRPNRAPDAPGGMYITPLPPDVPNLQRTIDFYVADNARLRIANRPRPNPAAVTRPTRPSLPE